MKDLYGNQIGELYHSLAYHMIEFALDNFDWSAFFCYLYHIDFLVLHRSYCSQTFEIYDGIMYNCFIVFLLGSFASDMFQRAHLFDKKIRLFFVAVR